MNIEDTKIQLSVNLPVNIGNSLFYHPTSFKEAARIGWSNYNQYLSTLLIDKSAYEKNLEDDIKNFDLFYVNCYHNEDFKNTSFNALRLFFMDEPELCEESGNVFIGFHSLGARLDHSNFDNLQHLLKIAHHLKIDKEEEFNAGNSAAQKMIDMILRNKSKRPPPKEKMDLNSIITSLAWKPNGLSILSIYDLNIYQIYQGFFVTNNIDDYYFTLSGIYAGTLDAKNIKMSDIHWANKIKD